MSSASPEAVTESTQTATVTATATEPAIKAPELPVSAAAAAAAVSAAKCEVCGLQDSKYKCPGCMTRTCSLGCSNRHKAETKCSGTRDKTKFVKRSEYDDNILMSDYGFLQDMNRAHANLLHEVNAHGIGIPDKTNNRSAASTPAAQSSADGGPRFTMNRSQKNICSRAKTQRQVQIRYMSPGIQRSKVNKTVWASTWSRLVWTLEIAVPELEPGPTKWIETGFHDVCKLADLWNRLLAFSPKSAVSTDTNGADDKRKRARTEGTIKIQIPSDDGQEHQFRSSIKLEMLQNIKQRFGGKSASDLVWLIRVQDMPANKPTFCKIDADQPLYTQLRYQTVLEFPTVYVYSLMPSTWNGHEITIREACTVDNNGDLAAIKTGAEAEAKEEAKEEGEAAAAASETAEQVPQANADQCELDQNKQALLKD